MRGINTGEIDVMVSILERQPLDEFSIRQTKVSKDHVVDAKQLLTVHHMV